MTTTLKQSDDNLKQSDPFICTHESLAFGCCLPLRLSGWCLLRRLMQLDMFARRFVVRICCCQQSERFFQDRSRSLLRQEVLATCANSHHMVCLHDFRSRFVLLNLIQVLSENTGMGRHC